MKAGSIQRFSAAPKLTLSVMVLVAFALRMGWCAASSGLGQYTSPDYREQLTLGTRIVTQNTFGNALTPDDPQPRPTAAFPPLYPLVVAGVFASFGIESPASLLVLQIINALATSLLPLLIFDVARRISASQRAAWVAAAITALHPIIIGVTPRPWDTSLFTLGVAGALWLAVVLKQHPARRASALAYGGYLGILAHVNPALTPAYPVLVLWMLAGGRSPRWIPMKLQGVALGLVGWGATLIPWAWRTNHELGVWCHVRDGFWQEVWLGACPEADDGLAAALRAHFPLRSAAASARLREVGEVAFFAEHERSAKAAITADPLRYVRLSLRRLADFWLGTVGSQAGGGARYWPQDGMRRGATVFAATETLLAILAVTVGLRNCRALGAVAAVLLLFSIVYALTHVELRYRMPIEPLMAILLAVGLCGRCAPDPPE